MNLQRENLLLYAVTDRSWVGKYNLFEQVEQALKGGVTIVQLREKHLSKGEFYDEAVRMKELCHRYGVPLIINDDVEIARKSGADGVHVGAEDSPVAEIRAKLGRDFIIGATAKTCETARRAELDGADYLGVGAVFPSPTKKNAIRITTDELKRICESVAIPVVAIGGINLENVQELRGGGMDGIATVSAIFGAEDIQKATAVLKKQVFELVKHN